MGQRTQIVIVEKIKNDGKTEVFKTNVEHFQFGHGKVMVARLLELANRAYAYTKYRLTNTHNLTNDTDEFYTKDLDNFLKEKGLKKTTKNIVENRVELFSRFDNNNGGMIIEVLYNFDNFETEISYCMLLGSEETQKPFEKKINALKYMNYFKNFNDENFTAGFKSLAKFFNFKPL